MILSKPLGSGVITTAFMRDLTSADEIAVATESMLRLNCQASEVAVEAGVLAMTDITGFGLLGHASEMLEGEEGLGFSFSFDALPTLPGAHVYGEDWVYPGGAHNNRQFYAPRIVFQGLDEWQELFCFSPETSGGLLMAVSAEKVCQVLDALEGAIVVGEVVTAEGIRVTR